ncbi:MAG: hypothetical protein BWY74_03409 [Firmicutes bacterium ADurb.Bin419]|nr:MAG: hypothetical protein BWY74_03409 [Firmicutes bacterium ADurb.Bin419]
MFPQAPDRNKMSNHSSIDTIGGIPKGCCLEYRQKA